MMPATGSRVIARILIGQARCPDCRSDRLLAVFDGEKVKFLCDECMSCWHVELGYFFDRVDAAECPGCPARLCEGRVAAAAPAAALHSGADR